MPIIETIPNVSEGRRPEVVDAIVAALTSVPNVYLLDRQTDADHNRAVITIAGHALNGEATATVLTGEGAAENSLAQPAHVAPATDRFSVSGTSFARTLPPRSLSVLRVPMTSH